MTLPLIHRSVVLVLNRQWMPVDAVSPADAFGMLASCRARGLRISEGSMNPLDWDAWQREEPMERDSTVCSTRGLVVIPTAILLSHFDKVPMVHPSFGFNGIWTRDGGRCQYSGRLLKTSEANIDHVLPKSRGGDDSWNNCVLSDRRINTRKGSQTPAEAGLKLLRQPRQPHPVPASARIRNPWNVADWAHFFGTPA